MIKRFQKVQGMCITEIAGQRRFAYAMSDMEDFFDMIEWAKRGGYQGAVILFYDLTNGKVHEHFSKKQNVLYGAPIYSDGVFYFLQGDFNENKITLYRYLPEKILESVTELRTEAVELYNLRLIGEQVHIISDDDEFVCYYPERISFPVQAKETVRMIADHKVYLETWVEEGWDDEKDQATDAYKYYEKVIVKDYEGKLLSEEIGSLNQMSDGSWWIS